MKNKRNHKLFWGSSYDRGLQHILKMWPSIKEKYNDAELHICYGWDLFIKGYANNPERLAWKDRIDQQMKFAGITHHGRISKKETWKLMSECGIWAYTTHFSETNCITALECQQRGCVPVTIDLAALHETVQSGVKIRGDIYDPETYDLYLEKILELMGDEKAWKEHSEKGKQFAESFHWQQIAQEWSKYL